MRIGIVGAMAEEIDLIKNDLEIEDEQEIGMRKYWTGSLYGKDAVLVFSRWGKVASASTVTTLIEKFDAGVIIFTGIAGATAPELKVGDIVIADRLVQYDMDVSPTGYISKFEIPLLGKSNFEVDKKYIDMAVVSANHYIENEYKAEIGSDIRDEFGLDVPKILVGTIASGDQFVADAKKIRELTSEIENLKCVEMEGAAVAQVCYEHSIPCIVMRVISDNADESAQIDCKKFINKTASHFTGGIIKRIIREGEF